MAPAQMYTLTRTPHQVADGEAPQEPELLETYIDGVAGEPWTGGYLRHEIGDAQSVPEHVARVVMADAGLRRHYTCDPPIAVSEAATERLVEGDGGPAPAGFSHTSVDPDADLSTATLHEHTSE